MVEDSRIDAMRLTESTVGGGAQTAGFGTKLENATPSRHQWRGHNPEAWTRPVVCPAQPSPSQPMSLDADPRQVFATKTFGQADQQRFAALSGDVNPMHMDPVAARRLLAGRQVVHGMHLLLHALEHLPCNRLALPGRITADFSSPVCVGDAVAFETNPDTAQLVPGTTGFRVRVGEQQCCHFELRPAAPPRPTANAGEPSRTAAMRLPPLAQAQEILDPPSWVGRCHLLDLPVQSAATLFPRTAQWLGERRVAALSLLSYYVGMVCPGLDSIYSSLTVQPVAEASDTAGLRFEVRRFDPRFPIYVISFDGCIRGEIKAFVRARALDQVPMADLLGLVEPGAFAGTRSWVIGGSRGLGELSAKLVAAGGGDVLITYATGADDARRVADEINCSGRGCAEISRLDLRTDALSKWCADQPAPNAVFYFATGRIFRRRTALFDSTAFDEFNDFYVRRFHELCVALERLDRPVRVFYPSSVAVVERPKGMTEYAMSKVAAELLIADWNRSARHVAVLASRLPRLATDQTSTALVTEPASNLDVMLPLVRQLLGTDP